MFGHFLSHISNNNLLLIAVFSLLVHNWFVSPGVYKMLTNGHSLISPLTDVIKPLPGFRKAFKR